MDTMDIYNVITLRTEVLEEMKVGCDVVKRIQDWARKKLRAGDLREGEEG